MTYRLMINKKICTGCRMCEVICSFFHDRIFRPAAARVHVVKDLSKNIDYPIVCRHCKKPKCLKSCPVCAITRDGQTGLVSIDYTKCTECKECVEACPFDAIFIHPDSGDILKCDYCNGDPKCVQYCEIGAIRKVNSNPEKDAKA